MNVREKRLAIVTGAMICLIILYTLANAMLLSPASALRNDAAKVRKNVEKLQAVKAAMEKNTLYLKKNAAKTFGRNEDEVRAVTFGYLMAALDKSGLTSEGKGVTKGATKNSNDLREIAWRVVKSGKMEHILNLLYMLESDEVLHRIENLSIIPREKDGPFRVEFDYIALSLATRKGKQFTTTRPSDVKVAINMRSDERKMYDIIPERDIFRRYIKRVIPPSPPRVITKKPTKPVRVPDPPTPRGPTPKYRICALPTFKGQPEIWVVNEIDKTGAVHKYKEGEKLMGWDIVMVDYRPLPDPDKPELLSPARVIVRIDSEYWAIEGNQYIAAKRLLEGSNLPPELRIDGGDADKK
jgi:hypothetical protein